MSRFEAPALLLINRLVVVRSVAQDELNAADQEKMIGIAILCFISLVTLVFYFFVKNAHSVIGVSAVNRVSRKTNLLCRFLPRRSWRRLESLMQKR